MDTTEDHGDIALAGSAPSPLTRSFFPRPS